MCIYICLVCDVIRSQDIPIGIRQTLIPIEIPQQQCNGDHCALINEEGQFICF
jgi:hypothetical protein